MSDGRVTLVVGPAAGEQNYRSTNRFPTVEGYIA